jgi:NAD(P)-dependent dehydrogenase (short-subunit alcohol dehydrogenase family)
MVASKSGLLVVVSYGTEDGYVGDFFYDLAQASLNRIAFACAEELRPHGVAALALSPGFVRTERVHDAGLGGEATETPLYAGRAVAALAADRDVARYSGRSLYVADLAQEYGFADQDGTKPARFRSSGD